MEPNDRYDFSSWGNLGVCLAFQPFDWRLSVDMDEREGAVFIGIGPFSLNFGWPVR